MRLTSFLLFLLLPLLAIGQAQREPNLLPTKEWIGFQWEGANLGTKYFDKAFMHVPCRIDSLPHPFKMQFDLGATTSMVYGNAIAPYLLAYPALAAKLDTINKPHRIQSKQHGSFKDVTIHLDKNSFRIRDLMHFQNFGIKLTADSVNSPTEKHIGTLGASFFRNRVLIIDYPNQQLLVVDSLDADTENRFNFLKCRMDKGRVKIPLNMNAKTHWVLFDTGSSVFPLVTSKKHFKKLTHGSVTDTLTVSNWGNNYTALGREAKMPVELGSEASAKPTVYMMQHFRKFFKQEKITGLTGNALFLEQVIAVDFRNERFGVLKK